MEVREILGLEDVRKTTVEKKNHFAINVKEILQTLLTGISKRQTLFLSLYLWLV